MRPPLCAHCGATEGRAFRLRYGHRPMATPTGHPPGAEWVCDRCDLRRRAAVLAGLLAALAASL